MIAPGLRRRQLFRDVDYVCTDCVTIVENPETGCPACTTRRENKEKAKQEFFDAMTRKKDEQRIEDARLRAEALSGLEVKS